MQDMGVNNVREFARRSGEDWSVVARHLRLLRLPQTILAHSQMPSVLRHFTVKQFDRLTKMPGDQAEEPFARDVAPMQAGCSPQP